MTFAKIDDLLSFRDLKLAIKMDIEGHELQALRGMRRLLSENAIFLQVEIFDDRKAEVFSFLEGELDVRHTHKITDTDYIFKKGL